MLLREIIAIATVAVGCLTGSLFAQRADSEPAGPEATAVDTQSTASLTRKQVLAIFPGFSAATGSVPGPSNVRIENIYQQNSSRATVQATFSYPMAESAPDKDCTALPGNKLEDCPL